MQEIGPQYSKDNITDKTGFLKQARMHQSKFRAEKLNLPYDTYGNYLTKEDAEKGANFFNGFAIFEAVQKYRKYNEGLYSNMLRSEHIPFNFFVPFNVNEEAKVYCKRVFNEFFNNTIQAIDRIEIEYAPKPREKYLNDATSFDAYIEYTHTDSSRGIIGIEVKFTEKAYKLDAGSKQAKEIADVNSKYFSITHHSNLYKEHAINILTTDTFRQVWRNHLLGESILMADSGRFNHFTSLILYPMGNLHFVHTSKEYMDLLLDNQNRFMALTYEDLFAACRKHCPNDGYREWLDYLTGRYLVAFDKSETPVMKNAPAVMVKEGIGVTSLRELLDYKRGYFHINREERNLAAIFYHVLLLDGNLLRFLDLIGCTQDMVESEMGVYFEYAFIRDLWSNIERGNNSLKRKIILDYLRLSNREELEKLTVLEFNRHFGAARTMSVNHIASPSNWSIRHFDKNIQDNDEFLKVCKFKWCFNAKPDIVINTSHSKAICIEAKFESGEGKYPGNNGERAIFKSRNLKPVGQLSIQKMIMEELLGIQTDYIFLVQKKSQTETHKTWTWKQAFDKMDTSGCPYFIEEWLKRL